MYAAGWVYLLIDVAHVLSDRLVVIDISSSATGPPIPSADQCRLGSDC